MPLSTLCVDDDQGATKALSSLLAEIVCALSILAKHWHVTDAIFAFEVHCQGDIVFDFKVTHCIQT